MNKTIRHRLLVVTTSYPLTRNGVSGIFVKRLNDALTKYFDIQVICPSSDFEPEVDVNEARYAFRSWQLLAQKPGGIPVALKNNKLLVVLAPLMLGSIFVNTLLGLRKSQYLMAHWSLSGLIAGVANIVYRRKSVVVFHGSDSIGISKPSTKRLFAWLALRLNTFCVGVSEDITNNLKAAFPGLSHKIHFVSNGVSADFLDVNPVEDSEILSCITVANLNPLKGVADILHALVLTDEAFKLSIVGDGPIRKELENLAEKLGIAESVNFMGEVSPDKLPHLMSEHQIFLLASYREGRPSVILEAMASSLAVVSTHLPGVAELLQNNVNGLMYEAGDVKALSARLKQLSSDPEMVKNLSRSARNTVLEKGLKWEDTADRYRLLLQGKVEPAYE